MRKTMWIALAAAAVAAAAAAGTAGAARATPSCPAVGSKALTWSKQVDVKVPGTSVVLASPTFSGTSTPRFCFDPVKHRIVPGTVSMSGVGASASGAAGLLMKSPASCDRGTFGSGYGNRVYEWHCGVTYTLGFTYRGVGIRYAYAWTWWVDAFADGSATVSYVDSRLSCAYGAVNACG